MHVASGYATSLKEADFGLLGQYRHKVFVERLGWELKAAGGVEWDQFDRPDAVYVVAKDDEGAVSGCARLLPTTGPYLLGEVFPQLMNGQALPSSPDVWEISRFAAVDLSGGNGSAAGSPLSSSTGAKIFREAMAFAAAHGAKRLIAVTWIGAERWLRKAGFHAHRAGPPMVVNGHPILACWIEFPNDLRYAESSSLS